MDQLECCTVVAVMGGLRSRKKVGEVVFVESEHLLRMTREGRTACPEIANEASGTVGDYYLAVSASGCGMVRDLGVMDCEGMRGW